jgi:hypothetical protein
MPEVCTIESKKQVPLIKVVRAAITDVWGNISELQQLYSFWASRGLKKLQRETLKVGKTRVLLTVNPNTKTATLPLDFDEDFFVGIINDKGQKVALNLSSTLADNCNIDEVDFEDKCTSCNQDKTICEDLAVTEEVTLVVINGNTYEDKVIKKLYPNGDYYLETTKWYLNITSDAVESNTTKEFITNFGLKPCGCLETTVENIAKIQTTCPDVFACHYACGCNEVLKYGYAIFEDTGLIQFDFNFPYSKVYLEYRGFMSKKNGQYQVPEVAFETLVEWTKYKAVKDKKGVEKWRIDALLESYTSERKAMNKVRARFSIETIIAAIRRTPKLNLDYNDSWYSCFDRSALNNALSGASGGSSSSSGGTGDNTTIINNYPTTIINNASYQLAVKTGNGAGHPVDNTTTYQNNILKNATDLNIIFLARQTLTKDDGDFSFDAVSGTITLTSSTFFTGDSLVVPYNKTT